MPQYSYQKPSERSKKKKSTPKKSSVIERLGKGAASMFAEMGGEKPKKGKKGGGGIFGDVGGLLEGFGMTETQTRKKLHGKKRKDELSWVERELTS
jgi:hypothetical protein